MGEEVHTPAPGTKERKDILDGLRIWVREHHQIEVIFVVVELKVKDGYAWAVTNPRGREGQFEYEPIAAMLKREKYGAWKVAFVDPVVEYLVSDNLSEAEAREKANRLLMREVPGVPKELVPRK